MPALNLDEIPRCAGQYFRMVGVNGDIVFNANPPNACRIYARFNGDYVSRLQALLLPSRHPGIFLNCESRPMPRPVNKERVKANPAKNLPRPLINSPPGNAAL